MGRLRKFPVWERPKEDNVRIDRITTKVRPIIVYQGVLGKNDHQPDFMTVQSSGFIPRRPFGLVNELEQLRRDLRDFQPTVYGSRKDEKWCSKCGDWRPKSRYTAKKGAFDGLHPYCNQCRAEHAQRIYYLGKEHELKAA